MKEQRIHITGDIEYNIVYSGRRTIGISILPDSRVVIRVPYYTTIKTIERLVLNKYSWILKHRDNYRQAGTTSQTRSYTNGELHLFRGRKCALQIERSARSYVRFGDDRIELGTEKKDDPEAIKKLLYTGYKREAMLVFPVFLYKTLTLFEKEGFKPSSLVIRTMKRRWGSCSNKGVITLSTELIKLEDKYIEYVITHELCHLKHHNHGKKYYELLTRLYPDWKSVRKELKSYIQ